MSPAAALGRARPSRRPAPLPGRSACVCRSLRTPFRLGLLRRFGVDEAARLSRPREAPSMRSNAGSAGPAWRAGRAGRARPIGRRAGRGRCSRRACAVRRAADVTELGRDRVGEHPADPGEGAEERYVAVVGAEPAQLALALADLVVELVDQAQAGLERALPRLGQAEAGEELAAAEAKQIGNWAGLAVREQDSVDALLQAGAVADEVEAPARALALGSHERVGQPDRRHEV